ncbi:aminotransferase class I/II-fold pyridoxal phosphate-dependent enzyme [Burkholderia sp. Bp9140]|uniref:aminotransferase class I/II-fold pyridoxal phosphate-dependent enzyme n=1 Tax=Burkholderia sp. Bp9140 TaxID=2184572 RepID=UPI000F579466|nr:aminotransferase class I/II-fold pyridoxal phosphate-dependent enzyme [Burkholderia sp. Bp9140]RQR51582.1 aminotransferase class I/II-fold pyridoxal phosphate-dependent enzyme [Burkholderia sp. Bp9140]
MAAYAKLIPAQLRAEYETVSTAFAAAKARNFQLDMSRGKPGKAQLDLVSDILTVLSDPSDCVEGDIDVRNYGDLMGIPSCRRLFAELLGTRPDEIFVGGSASMKLMYDVLSRAYLHGLLHSPKPWAQERKIKFLCPSPGYDNHFRMVESLGAELITIRMTETGPDMAAVEEAVADLAVKGIWCVPKYSNPQGIIYSHQTIARLAALRPAAPDFTIMWDNAYFIHEFDGEFVPIPDMLTVCREAGNPDMVFEFASTSKVTLPGAGVAVFATSEANIAYMKRLLSAEIISYDKVNMLRHVRYLKDKQHALRLMKQHGAIMKPKFDAVCDTLDREIRHLGIGHWRRPKGGYFISYDAMPGTATRTLALCKDAGVLMTHAGATFPYGVDPDDSNIRIAPSLPSDAELRAAIDVFCICVRLAALEKLIESAGRAVARKASSEPGPVAGSPAD